MVKDSFFLISTGSLDAYPDNTRSSFKNALPKTAKVHAIQNEFYISLDQLNFEQSYNYYKKQEEPAFNYEGTQYECKIRKNHYTIDSLLLEINEEIKNWTFAPMKIEKDIFNPNYVILTVKKGSIPFFSKYFQTFLNLPRIPVDSGADSVFRSAYPVKLLEYFPEYVNIYCEDVDEYSSNSSSTKIIASIPIDDNYYGGSIHHDSENNHYFRLSRDNIRTISLELRHPNGSKLFLSRGPPTIIKANIKEMNPLNDFFYVQVSSSKSLNHPLNTISKFHTTLPKEYILNGEWKVALTNLYLPSNILPIFKNDYTIYNNPDEDDRRILFVKHVVDDQPFINEPVTKWTPGVDTPYEFIFPRENFTRSEFMIEFRKDFLDVLNIEVDSDENFIISTKNLNGKKIKIQFYMTKKLGKIIFKNFARSNIGDFNLPAYDNLPLILQDAILRYKEPDKLYKASFIPIEFRKKFNDLFPPFNFELYYEEVDADTHEEKEDAKKAKTQNKKSRKKVQEILETLTSEEQNEKSEFDVKELNPAWMFIYTDFVSPTIIGDKYSNLLKLIPYKKGVKSGGFYSFSSLDFFNVNKTSIRTIEFNIKTHSGSDFRYFNDGSVSMTLIFKKIS